MSRRNARSGLYRKMTRGVYPVVKNNEKGSGSDKAKNTRSLEGASPLAAMTKTR